VHFNKEGLG